MTLCSLWVLMVAFDGSLGLPFEGAFVEGVPELSWVANNTAKLAMPNHSSSPSASGPVSASRSSSSASSSLECWTIISSREFGSQHKVPQEAIPPAKAKEVTQALLEAFGRAAGLAPGDARLAAPPFSRVQLWGAAVPLNVLAPGPFVFEPGA